MIKKVIIKKLIELAITLFSWPSSTKVGRCNNLLTALKTIIVKSLIHNKNCGSTLTILGVINKIAKIKSKIISTKGKIHFFIFQDCIIPFQINPFFHVAHTPFLYDKLFFTMIIEIFYKYFYNLLYNMPRRLAKANENTFCF